MGIVLGARVADLLAEVGEGLILDPNQAWWVLREDGSSELLYEGE